jgi:hypothetical protein
VPLLIIHGVNDEMVPIEHSQALYQHSNTRIPPVSFNMILIIANFLAMGASSRTQQFGE